MTLEGVSFGFHDTVDGKHPAPVDIESEYSMKLIGFHIYIYNSFFQISEASTLN